MSDLLGQRIGNYRITRLLGQGGFAKVYLGEHLHLKNKAAIKVLSAHLDTQERETFLKEARTLAQFSHPHIVRVLDFDLEERVPFLVMEYVPHGTLRQRYPNGTRLPLTDILTYVRQIAAALHYLHEQKVIHRDIKPQNLLLGDQDHLFLGDFGIAVLSQSSHAVSPLSTAGTIAYMAPEQIRGHPRRASDQYALGILVYEWLVGYRPFQGSYAEVASNHLLAMPPSLCASNPALSQEIEAVIQRALVKEPDQRFATIQEFASALQQAITRTLTSSSVQPPTSTQPFVASSIEQSKDLRSAQTNQPSQRVSAKIPKPQATPLSFTQQPSASPLVPNDQKKNPSGEETASLRRELQTQAPSHTVSSPQVSASQVSSQSFFPPRSPQAISFTLSPSHPSRQRSQPTQPRHSRVPFPPKWHLSRKGWVGILIALTLLLMGLSILCYVGPTATVTLSLQAVPYNQILQLNATTNSQVPTSNQVSAHILEHTFTANGQGLASGTTSVGNAKAQGLVTITNNGNTDVTIPVGSIFNTPSGIQFSTTAEVFVQQKKSQPAIPITAQQAGLSGNIPSGSITIIPSSSLMQIAELNQIGLTSINLTITNPQSTSGGGTKIEPAVTLPDIQALRHTLHQNMQQQVSAWVLAEMHPGDLHGTPIPNVLATSTPLLEEQLSGTPKVGQAVSSGTFSGTLSLLLKVLVVRFPDIQAAASAQLSTAARHMHPAFLLATQLPLTLQNEQGMSSQDGTTLAIRAEATGAIIHQIAPQDISAAVAGKSVREAMSIVSNHLAQEGILHVQIQLFPAFFPGMPLWSDRIRIVLLPVETQ